MKTLIERYINWSQIGKHAKREYIYSIGNTYIQREIKRLNIEIKLNFIIPFADVQKLKAALQREFPQLSDVAFYFFYEKMILEPQEIIRLAIPHMIEEINGTYAHLTRTIFTDEYTLRDSLLQIKALGETAVSELNEKTARIFERIIKRDFNLELQVRFLNHQDSYMQKEQEKAKLDAKELESIKNAIKEAEANAAVCGSMGGDTGKGSADSKPWQKKGARLVRQKYTPVEGNRIMGEDIEGEAVPLKTLHSDSGSVIIEGRVFRKEGRALKSGRQLITLLVTDTTNSICVKIFANEQKWNEIDEHIKVGTDVRIRGNVEFDSYENAIVLMGRDMEKIHKDDRKDLSEEKRVELHVHTKMSAMDGLIEISDLIKTAGSWGHKALAITDHGVVQAFPEAAKAVKKNKLDIKLIFGLEGYLLDDEGNTSAMPTGLDTSGEYVVFDLETTGLSPTANEIIEIGAVKVKNKVIIDEFLTFVKPSVAHLPEKITELTGITDDMLKDAPPLDEIFDSFMTFIGDLPLVAHNADFDISFVRVACAKRGKELLNAKVDTLYMSRTLLKDLKRHKLNLVANALGVALENHHRAVDDAKAAAGILIKLFDKMEEAGFTRLNDIEKVNGSSEIDYKTKGTNHIILLAKNQEGLKNIYELVSRSHLDFFYKKPRIPKSVLLQYREGIIIGSACEAGQIYRAVLEKRSEKEIEKIIDLYDYLEIQPLCNNHFLIEKGKVIDEEELKQINRSIIALGEKYGKPVVATCDAHYKDKEDAIYRKILMAGQGYKDVEDGEGLYLRTTEEMLDEFSYLGEELAKEVVISAPNAIADMVECVIPVPEGKFPPKIDGAEERLRSRCMETAWGIYGMPLPELVQSRLEKELDSIIGNGYAVMYVSAEMLVQKSLKDGYLVGSRGSVGSSFAATMAGITEVNPLVPHYICQNPECKHVEFIEDGSYDCGVDMPDKNCPKCGRPYKKDGYSIPFETFLGFEGDKEPDIDLNFAGEYQPVAHKFVEEIFGKENVFRAGTIGTVAMKTAFGFVLKYFEERGQAANKWEIERLATGCTGVRRTTGQHPGGIIIVPRGHTIYEFCPVQHPANDTKTDIITTHYDYHSIDENLLKLDILGHDVPSMIRQLQDLTGEDPLDVPLDDKKTMGIFNGIEGLDIKINDYKYVHGSYGIPEFGTKFVRQMLDDTHPKRFADLVRISGFSHGTDVWINNAQEFIRNGEASMSEAISTRDDIMNYLILKGVPKKASFKIMECVRKGKGLTPDQVEIMEANDVPEWYIESCRRIKYMFPRAHAVAYVMMSYRIAYYKVYFPAAFYAVFFTMKISEFNADVILNGLQAVQDRIKEIENKGKEATKKEEDEVTVLEVAYEMYARGFEFLPAKLGKSDSVKFEVVDGKVLIPFLALNGVGESAAKRLTEEWEAQPFFSIEEIRTRAKLNRTAIEALKNHGVLKGMPESDQMSLF
ncbi:PolC-type DNA polymerase III [Sinanaerobacter sp. ZZT-01]|uniref:PolC-type DNA polymerase III n=1 Tax=Sinanaerobacter sp. ZZT-01 TaxID=3111540 RepID=UPI002D771FA7|nr:PolC-type DNA polymerase III [Sinanaerobacter sp. ZZT-01]WRR93232.1 PolC-type DNA polymerase III [Sinanaerobacter sp. ZZT-01]